ncbi:MAG: chemotaxis protein CheW [Magnetospirillum sp.]|nr:chemotaxis protein CheW [Magnetospirillum sp.]
MMLGDVRGDGAAVVVFHLADQVFGVSADHVAEVVPNAWLARPPALTAMMAGILDLRGAPLVVLRGDRLLGMAEQTFGLDASIMVMKDGARGGRVGLMTGRVLGVRPLSACRALDVAPEASFRGCLKAQLAFDDVAVSLLDWSLLLDAEEQLRLAEFGSRARDRQDDWKVLPE